PTIFRSVALTSRMQSADQLVSSLLALTPILALFPYTTLFRSRLQRHAAGPGQRGQEDAVAAEQRVLDAGDGGDVELHALLVHADVSWMHPERVSCLQVVHHDFAVQLHPRMALADEPLHPKSGAAEDAGAEALLKADGELDTGCAAHEAVAVDHVAVPRRDLQREDLPWQLRREREQALPADRRVLRHEESSARDRPAERAEKAALLAAGRGRRLPLH